VERQLTPGDHIISSYGYVNRCFQFVRRHGGKTFLDGGNSHPRIFWETISEEHRRWGCGDPPYAEFQHLRALRNMEDVDYVLCPSQWVRSTFLAEGFRPEQLLDNVYPLDVSRFVTDPLPRPKERPLTLISTGSVSLRKGFPYLLEAYDRLWRDDRSIRLLLTDSVSDSMKPVLRKYAHLPIEWAPYLPHDQLTKRLHSADLYLLPSLEEGFARTVAEALGCGLPAIVTERTGSNDIVRTGVNGDVVPIRDAGAIVDAVRRWAPRVMEPTVRSSQLLEPEKLGFPWFAQRFLEQLRKIGLV
jgi:glycosyltransferase involved in cell wall biosynthesis